MVLSEGRLVFFSDVKNVQPWFVESLDYYFPSNSSEADFVMDLGKLTTLSISRAGQNEFVHESIMTTCQALSMKAKCITINHYLTHCSSPLFIL